MRVALVIAGPFPAFRGSQVLVAHLADGLRSRGHSVEVVTYGRRLAERPGPGAGRLMLDVALVVRLLRCIRRAGIDVVHAHNYEAAIAGLIAGRLTGRPVVYHGHCSLVDELPTYASSPAGRRLAAQVGRLLDRHIPRRADFCIAVTDDLGAHLRTVGVRDDAVVCIEPVVAPAEFRAAPEDGREPLVCYAGNLDGYQNLDGLLEAFRRIRAAVPATRLLLVTHADARANAVRLLAGRQADGVEIVHAASYDEVRTRLARAAIAVCPRSERSGFPMKLLNYMAEGKAIVASAGSAKGLVHGRTALVVPDGDVAGFADAVVALLRDPDARQRLGRAARAAVEDRAPWESVLDRIESIYHRVVVGPGVPAVVAPARGVRS